jgi:hypothetical protein
MKHDDTSYDARLHEIAQRLGSRAAERLDVDAVVRNVVAGLREQPARRRTWIELHALRIAAALVLLLGGSVVVTRLIPRSGTEIVSHPAHLVADDLSDLTTDELRAVLNQFDEMVDSTGVVSDSSDLRELDAQELRAVLRSLEG